MVESGPASGVWGAAELGKLIGEPNVLALDIGGTTAKCAIVERGLEPVALRHAAQARIRRLPAALPVIGPGVAIARQHEDGRRAHRKKRIVVTTNVGIRMRALYSM